MPLTLKGDDAVWRLFVFAYMGPKSRTERPRKAKIGTEVAHVTRELDTTLKDKRSRSQGRGWGILWRPPAQLVFVLSCPFLMPGK